MTKLEYDGRVRHWILASGAAFALLVALASVCGGQARGFGSVPSPTGAVQPFTGAVQPATGSVRPPTSTTPSRSGLGSGVYTFSSGSKVGTDKGHQRRHRDRDQYGGYYVPYAVAIPYAPDADSADDNAEPDNDADYQGGPTVFDRRGYGADSYVPPVENVRAAHSDQAPEASADEKPQPATILVFKDGHTIEVGNYAILGGTLFDLTPGHARRIALATLNLDATRQQNDDRGVVFQLPASAQGS